MKKTFEDFKNQTISLSQSKSIKGGNVNCYCVYTGADGVGWDESGSCAGSNSSTCASQGASKYAGMRGTCSCNQE